MNKEERLKHWHIRCLNCDNLIIRVLKNDQAINRDDSCSDCGNVIHTRIGCDLKFLNIFGKDQWVVIKCKFSHENS